MQNWNDRVGPGDTVYHLGDFAMGNKKYCASIFHRLNGKITLVQGNHDKHMPRWFKDQFVEVHHYLEINPKDQKICLMHFPIESWNKCHRGAWHLHGHCHNNLTTGQNRKRMDVGVDAWDYSPVSLEEISEAMKSRGFVQVDHHGA